MELYEQNASLNIRLTGCSAEFIPQSVIYRAVTRPRAPLILSNLAPRTPDMKGECLFTPRGRPSSTCEDCEVDDVQKIQGSRTGLRTGLEICIGDRRGFRCSI